MSWLDSPARLARSWSTSMWVRRASLPQSSLMLMANGEDLRMVLSFSACERSTPASSPRTRIEIGINVGGPFSTVRTSMRAPGTRAESASWSGAISALVSSLCVN